MAKALPTKEKIQEIRKDIELALNAIAEKHSISKFNLGTIRYDESCIKVPVEAVFEGGESQEMKDLRFKASYLGFKEDIVNAIINYGGKSYKVVGLKRTNLLIESQENGKVYLTKVTSVFETLNAQKSDLILKDIKTVSQK